MFKLIACFLPLFIYVPFYGYSQIRSHVFQEGSNDLQEGYREYRISLAGMLEKTTCRFPSVSLLCQTNLFSPSVTGDTEKLEKLLLKGADPNAFNLSGDVKATPLHWAIVAGQENSVFTLLEHNADPNLFADKNAFNSPLCVAAHMGQKNIVKMLLQKGAQANLGHQWKTPLNCAIRIKGGNPDHHIVAILLNHGADPDTSDHYGDTPLHFVARKGYWGLSKMLSEGTDADMEKTNLEGKMPHEVAASEELANYLFAYMHIKKAEKAAKEGNFQEHEEIWKRFVSLTESNRGLEEAFLIEHVAGSESDWYEPYGYRENMDEMLKFLEENYGDE